MKIINGRKIANQILVDLKKEIKLKKIKPCLAVILIGNNPASNLYVKLKQIAAKKVGIKVIKKNLSDNVSEQEVLEIINRFNQDSEINGILVQLPLPNHLSKNNIVQAISSEKDIDGFSSKSKFDPPLIMAIEKTLEATGEEIKVKKAIALVNSDVFGKMLKSKLKINYQIGFIKDLKEFDVIITALGGPNVITGSMIKQGVILIDGGINIKDGKIVGDIDMQSVKNKAGWISPVPGGVGPLTVAFLLKNIV